MIVAKVDARSLQRNLNRISMYTGKDMDTLVKQSARRVCVNLSRTVAPFGFGEDAKLLGETAVENDYNKTTIVRNETYLRNVIAIAGRKNNITETLTSKGGDDYDIDWREVSFVQSKVYKSHNLGRSRRTGRAFKRESNDRMVTSYAVVEKAKNKSKKRVGLAKHAYALAAKSLGGARGIPAWVKRSRRSPKAGSATIINKRGSFSVVIRNNLPYTTRILSKHGEMSSLKRESDYLAQQAERDMKRYWK